MTTARGCRRVRGGSGEGKGYRKYIYIYRERVAKKRGRQCWRVVGRSNGQGRRKEVQGRVRGLRSDQEGK